jgi:hypothetical protein
VLETVAATVAEALNFRSSTLEDGSVLHVVEDTSLLYTFQKEVPFTMANSKEYGCTICAVIPGLDEKKRAGLLHLVGRRVLRINKVDTLGEWAPSAASVFSPYKY